MKKALLAAATAVLSLASCMKLTQFNENATIVSENEIAGMNITCFAEDYRGFIWFGTDGNGLLSYNGDSFLSVRSFDDEHKISSQTINVLLSDEDRSRLWIGTSKGLDMLLFREVAIRHIDLPDRNVNIRHIIKDRNGDLLVGTSKGIYILYEEKMVLRGVITFDFVVPYYNIFPQENGDIYVATDTEVIHYNSSYLRVSRCQTGTNIRFSACDYESGTIILGPAIGKALSYDISKDSLTSAPKTIADLDCGKIYSGFNLNDGSIVMISDNVHYLYNGGAIVSSDQTEYPYHLPAPHSRINQIFIDSRGNTWIGMSSGGYQTSTPDNSIFGGRKELMSFMYQRKVTSMASNGSNIFLVVDNAELWHYNTISRHIHEVNIKEIINFNINFNSLNWVRSARGNKLLLNLDNMILQFIIKDDNGCLSFAGINSLIPLSREVFADLDIEGNVWAGASGGEGFYRSVGELILKKAANVRDPEEHRGVSAVKVISDGRVVTAYRHYGLVVVDPYIIEGDKDFPYQQKIDLSEQFSDLIIKCIFEFSPDCLWLGTAHNGIIEYNFSSGQVREIPYFHGKQEITDILRAVDGSIYVLGQNGLYRYSTINRFAPVWISSEAQILPSGSLCCLDSGEVIANFTTPVCYNSSKTSTYSNRQAPEVFVSRKDIVCTENFSTYVLDYTTANLTYHVATADFTPHKAMRYAYKMDRGNWVFVGTSSIMVYNIGYGRHTFYFKSIAPEGNEESAIAQSHVMVRRPWYFSILACIIYCFTVVMLCLFIIQIYYRIRRVRLQAEMAHREKQMQERLNLGNMDFFANISHEFRTPLTIICGSADVLCLDPSLDNNSRRLAHIMKRNADRMLKLVSQLLDFNKIEHEVLTLSVDLSDTSPQLKEIVDSLSFGASQKDLSIELQGCDIPHKMYLDNDKFEKIMYNLLSNAIKYTQPGGHITVSCSDVKRDWVKEEFPSVDTSLCAGWILISVADNGIGIPPDKLSAVFDRFFTGVQVRRSGGVGIGLYYTKSLCAIHHGDIKAAPNPGGGSIFSFVLPCAASAYSEEEKTSSHEDETYHSVDDNSKLSEYIVPAPEEDAPGSKPNVLVIDDDYEMAYFVKSILAPHYNVTTRFDAMSGYKIIESETPDLVISDVMMLEMDGLQLCSMVRDNIAISHIPFILLTAKSTVADQIKGIGSGADAYVVKPFNAEYLLQLVKTTLENRERARRLVAEATIKEPVKEGTLSPRDKALIDKLYTLMEENLTDSELNIALLMQELTMSRTKLFYKIKALTGKTPNELFRAYKLNRAQEMIRENKYKLAAIADMTGFSSASHFTRIFKEHFGISPSKYAEQCEVNE